MKIENSVILITGGASGLGENMALYFYNQKAIVYICDLNFEKGKKIEVGTDGGIKFIKCDVTSEKEVENMIAQIEKEQERLDVLINSAGVLWTEGTACDTQTHSLAGFEKCFRINTLGAFNVSKQAAKLMAKNYVKNKKDYTNEESFDNGCIIFISSASGIEGRAGKLAYSMSKAALIGMTLPMARDLGKYKIRVNTIAPLMIETPMNTSFRDTSEGKKLKDCIPLKKFGKSYHVSDLIEMIIKNDFMNAEVIRIDGGGRIPHF